MKRRIVLETVAKSRNDTNSPVDEDVRNDGHAMAAINLPEHIPKDGFMVIANTIRQTLMEVTEIQEQNNERRHRELMEILQQFCTNSQSSQRDKTSQEELTLHLKEENNEIDEVQINTEKADEGKSTSTEQVTYINLTNPPFVRLPPTVQDNANPAECTKKEFNEMRRKMLEIQRKKMEDRERKKMRRK